MLSEAKIVAFAATKDGARSRAFYEGVLGLRCQSDDSFAIVFDATGTELRIQKVDGLRPQPHTVLGWSVASIEAAMAELALRGVTFERFAFLSQTASGAWTSPNGAKVAWFKDPDGNLLSLTQR